MSARRRPAAGEAAYRRLARELRTAVLQGRYAGGRLPTEAELASTHGVSRQTVRRAFHDLVAEGIVHRVPGRGTFPVERDGKYLRQFGSIEDLMGLAADTRMEVVSPLARTIDLDAAGRLRLGSDVVHRLTLRRLHGEVTLCVTTVALPPQVAALLADLEEVTVAGHRSRATVIGLLDPRLPSPISDAEQSITAVRAGPEVAEALGVDPDAPVLRVDRLYTTAEGEPVELAITHFDPEHYSYRVHLRRSVAGGDAT